jgi:hypothetical protein
MLQNDEREVKFLVLMSFNLTSQNVAVRERNLKAAGIFQHLSAVSFLNGDSKSLL